MYYNAIHQYGSQLIIVHSKIIIIVISRCQLIIVNMNIHKAYYKNHPSQFYVLL